MPPTARGRRGSCAPGATDADLLALFHEMDTDSSGELSIHELGAALQTNSDFARVATGKPDAKPLNALAAGLVAQNLRNIADHEFGNANGVVCADEFVQLCRRLMGEANPQPPASARKSSESSAPASSSKKSANKGSLLPFGLGGGSKQPSAREGRAEAKLFGLTTMLRNDVVGPLEALLQRVKAAPEERKVTIYYDGVCAALASCKRLADSVEWTPTGSGGGGSGGGGGAAVLPSNDAEAEALELQQLRRDLSGMKLQLAEAVLAREAAEFELRHAKQEQAAAAGRPRGRSSILG